MKVTINCCKIIFPLTRTFSSMFTQTFSQKFTAPMEKRGFDLKSNFHIIFKTYTDKKQLESSMGKNPVNYESIRKETKIYQQNR